MPAKAAEIEEIATMFGDAMEKTCAQTIALAKSANAADKKSAAIEMRQRCDPAMNEVMRRASALTNVILKVNDAAAEAALAVTNATIRNTFAIVLGGSALVLLFVARGVRSITLPITRLGHRMQSLSQGDFATEIEGVGRRMRSAEWRARCWSSRECNGARSSRGSRLTRSGQLPGFLLDWKPQKLL